MKDEHIVLIYMSDLTIGWLQHVYKLTEEEAEDLLSCVEDTKRQISLCQSNT